MNCSPESGTEIKRRRLPALRLFGRILLLGLALSILGCATTSPKNTSNACRIFSGRKSWYKATKKSYKKWGVPIYVQLAIIRQESNFDEDAKPPRKRLLWVIPWTRPSSAYGYAQVIDETWEWYKDSTGRWFADRDDFSDVADFIGWYGRISHRKLGISKDDAYRQYLAYHEGHGGYKRKTYRKKKWLRDVARKVEGNSKRYRKQLRKCEEDLNRSWFWPF